ncbi:hypothetical protein BH09BAC4_BH09BAC4_40430 [soil metagenome]
MVNITEALRSDGKLWVVIVVVMIVLIGWLYYLLKIGGRINKVRKKNGL